MGHGTLKLNFFPVRFPEANLPFLLRDKLPDEPLLATEREWIETPPDTSIRYSGPSSRKPPVTTALAVGRRDPAHDYETKVIAWTEAPPSAIRALVLHGLATELATKNLDIDIDNDPVGFHCFERTALPIAQGEPVTLNKGIHFKVDHIVTAGNRIYGFFVSLATRLNIPPDISHDELLGRAAQGERVEYELDGKPLRGTLQSIDRNTPRCSARVRSSASRPAVFV